MPEREISVERAYQEFLEKGGVFIGKEEWDEILIWIDGAYEKYVETHSNFNDYGHDFPREVWLASIKKVQKYEKVTNGRIMFAPIYIDTYIRQDGEGHFYTLLEVGDNVYEVEADRSEVIVYLAMKVRQGEISFGEACKELQ